MKVQLRSGSEFDLSEIGDVFESDLIHMHYSYANTLKIAFDFNSVSSGYLDPGKCSSLIILSGHNGRPKVQMKT